MTTRTRTRNAVPARRRAGLQGRRGSQANRLGILISGRGSNMQAILDRIARGRLDARVALVISNKADAPGLTLARRRGVKTVVIDHRQSASREAHDRRMAAALEAEGVRLVCLAGYMLLLSPWFVRRFAGAILNIHPSLLPAFPGIEAQRQALEHGVKVTGCTVHFVNEDLDAGPIIAQEAVRVRDDDTPATLAARILKKEHRLYGEAITLALSGREARRTGRR
jgi:phosphoribosylglycinamide formyltransferase-1